MKEIKLTQGKVALVDDEDFERINQWKWFAAKSGNTFYAKRFGNIRMHRVVMGITSKHTQIIDHANGDGLDNRKGNLRICSNRENSANRRSAKNSSSKYLGVCYEKKRGKWVARITANKKVLRIGYFKTEENAATAYNIFAERLHGKFARLNTANT